MSYEIEKKICSKNGWHTPAEAKAYYGKYSRQGITFHWWGGGEGADAHDRIVNSFLNWANNGQKSVHYVVSDSKITQMVENDNVSWCSNNGNPTTISIEHQPTLGEEGYRRSAQVVYQIEKQYGYKMQFYRHSDWTPTACPGSIDLNKIRQYADELHAGAAPLPNPTPAPTPAPTPTPSSNTLYLPPVDSWAVYRVGSGNRKGTSDQVGTLRPGPVSNGTGLTYDLLEDHGDYGVIQTRDFGRVQIWLKDTGAVRSSSGAPSVAPAPAAPAVTRSRVLNLPPVDQWRVYPLDKSPVVGNEVGFILPKKYAPLSYEILGNPYPNTYTIQTRDYGRVNIWGAPDTGATIS